MTEILTILNDELEALNIPYTFDEWDNEIELPQFIGEIHETPTNDEDGLNEYSFILTGYGTNYSELFEFSDKLKTKYKTGAIVNNIVITYKNTDIIENNTEDLKQIQINLKIKNWSI